jgi:uncharacterized protein YjbJ (UPF0337 family)
MIHQQELADHWNEVCGKLKEKWATLADDDLRNFNGNVDQLIGRIQQKTGESREAIERFLGQFSKEGSELLEAARERVQETADHFADGMRQSYAEAERVVQERPGQALAVAFGVGLLAGIGVTLLLRSSGRQAMLEHDRGQCEHFGRYMRDMLAHMMPEPTVKNGH